MNRNIVISACRTVATALLLIIFMASSSCSDWLDVRPKTEEEASVHFSTDDGFKSALAGVYIMLSKPELYGKELTFGMIGMLAQEWGDGDDLYSNSDYNYLRDYNYERIGSKWRIESVWTNMYKAIANINTLLQYSELQGSVLNEYNYGVIRGEALALRAFMHFELFRMFAPHDFSDASALYIPYVVEPEPVVSPQLTANAFFDLALKDIDEALELLKVDPIHTGADVTGVDNGYLANRNFHLNYYAVLGLKARVALYKGDHQKALSAAREVIGAKEQKGLFPWVDPNDLTTTYINLRDRTFSSEHLFALHIPMLNEYIKGCFREFTKPRTVRINPNSLYEPDDYRKAIYETYSGASNVLSKFWQMDNEYIAGTGTVKPKRDRMPVIRVSEMYYIEAECLKESDLATAVSVLNKLRGGRGLEPIKGIDSAEKLQEELTREYYREFVGEGQLYFYHKRLGTPNIDKQHANANYVFPMPDLEIDLGKRE